MKDLIKIFTFGGVNILKRDQIVSGFRSQKAMALFCYLAVESRTFLRDYLAEAFWPDLPPNKSLRNLRVVVNNLKNLFNHVIISTRRDITVDKRQIWIDTDNLKNLGKTSTWHEIKELYQGKFLEGFYISNNSWFQEWVIQKQLLYQNYFLLQAETTITYLIQNQDFARALHPLKHYINENPSNHDFLAKCLTQYRDSNQRRHLQELLSEYQNAVANSDFIQAEQQILRLSNDIPKKLLLKSHWLTPVWLSEPNPKNLKKFISRNNQLEELTLLFNSSIEGKGKAAIIQGEAGSGKTSLVKEFLSQLESSSPDILISYAKGQLGMGELSPLLPIREMAEFLLGNLENAHNELLLSNDQIRFQISCLPEIWKRFNKYYSSLGCLFHDNYRLTDILMQYGLENELQAEPQYVSSSDLSSDYLWKEVASGISEWLKAIAYRRKIVVVIEDYHWIDLTSASIINFLIRRLINFPVFFVITFRIEEFSYISSDYLRSLSKILYELELDNSSETIDLDKVNFEESQYFVEEYFKHNNLNLSDNLKKRISELSHGNPFYIEEYWNYLTGNNFIEKNGVGDWCVNGSSEVIALPQTIHKLLQVRLSSLPDEIVDYLQIASIEGNTFSANTIAEVLNCEIDQVISSLSKPGVKQLSIYKGLGRKASGNKIIYQYRFTHTTFQLFFLNSLDQNALEYFHGLIGDILESRYGKSVDEIAQMAGIISSHYLFSKNINKAIRYLTIAGNHALKTNAFDEAIRLFRKSLMITKLIEDDELRNEYEINLQIGLISPLQATKGYKNKEVVKTYNRLDELMISTPEGNLLKTCLYLLKVFYPSINESNSALNFAEKILSLTDPVEEPLVKNLAHWTLAYEKVYQGKFEEANFHLSEMMKYLEWEKYDWVTNLYGNNPAVAAHARMAWVLWFKGQTDIARYMATKALDLAQEFGHDLTLGFTIGIAGVLFNQLRCDIPEMDHWNQVSRYHSQKEGIISYQASEQFSQNYVLWKKGSCHDSVEKMEEAWKIWKDSGARRHAGQYSGMLAEALSESGQLEKGLSVVDFGFEKMDQNQEYYFAGELHRIKGSIYVLSAQYEEAILSFQESLRWSQKQNAVMWQIKTKNSLAELLEVRGKFEEAFLIAKEGLSLVDLDESEPILIQGRHTLDRIQSKIKIS